MSSHNSRRQDRCDLNQMTELNVENKVKNEDGQISVVELGRMRHRGDKHQRGFRGDPRGPNGVDRNFANIKKQIPSFKGRNDPKVHLEWEKKLELIFDSDNCSNKKKMKLAMIELLITR